MKAHRIAYMLALAALPAVAHHGWSEYDSSTPVRLTGKIVASGYEHPHGHLRLETAGKTWHVVLAPPSRMERRGLPAERLREGTTASVEGFAHREKKEEMRAERIRIGEQSVELR